MTTIHLIGSTSPSEVADRIIPIGTAVNLPDLDGSDPRYRETLRANFTGITPENEMKWETIEPQPGVLDFGPADAIVDFARAHGMDLHGHTLVWDQQLPAWLTSGSWTRPELEEILRRHITAEVEHFRGAVTEWDVINEPFDDDGAPKRDIFSEVIGPDYIPLALTWAHDADPGARLFINDYNIDWPGPKHHAMAALVDRLQADGVPLHGIGMEEHLSLSWSPSAAQLTAALEAFASRGLLLEITEADVATTGFAGTDAQAQDRKASVFGTLAAACRAQPACVRFTVWGVGDAVSWLGPAAAGLPFDAAYEPTAAWRAILTGLANPSPAAR